MGVCEKCGGTAQREQGFARQTRRFADMLLPVLRHVAEQYGYALATHGSMAWDIDIVLCPWREKPCDAESVVKALHEVTKSVCGDVDKELQAPTCKPCGRLTWVIHLTHYFGNGPYLDISVMPFEKGTADTSDYPWLKGESK